MIIAFSLLSALLGVILAGFPSLINHVVLRKKLNVQFQEESDKFFIIADKLLKTEGSLPESVLNVLKFGGHVLGDRKAPKFLYRALKKARTSTVPADARRKWEEDINKLSNEQVTLFAEANKHLTKAVMGISTRYAAKISTLFLEEVLEKPERKVRNAEIKIGLEVMRFAKPHSDKTNQPMMAA